MKMVLEPGEVSKRWLRKTSPQLNKCRVTRTMKLADRYVGQEIIRRTLCGDKQSWQLKRLQHMLRENQAVGIDEQAHKRIRMTIDTPWNILDAIEIVDIRIPIRESGEIKSQFVSNATAGCSVWRVEMAPLQAKSGLFVGTNRGHTGTKPELAPRPSTNKGKRSKRTNFVRKLIREVAGFAPYEKRALKVAKKKLGTHKNVKKKREETSNEARLEELGCLVMGDPRRARVSKLKDSRGWNSLHFAVAQLVEAATAEIGDEAEGVEQSMLTAKQRMLEVFQLRPDLCEHITKDIQLHIAQGHGHSMEALLRGGGDEDAASFQGITALFCATSGCRVAFVEGFPVQIDRPRAGHLRTTCRGRDKAQNPYQTLPGTLGRMMDQDDHVEGGSDDLSGRLQGQWTSMQAYHPCMGWGLWEAMV
ncbi:hypothetical protein SUGI_0962050 [Cryptomeria japonica]|nr:hypothetical protein SUGI_0962050 [Cryptomeria japonica]